MMKNVVLLFLFFVCLNIFPQGVKVKEVKETVSGSDAFHAPMDENGHPCGLVKVLTTIGDLTFEGNVKGVVENKTNEYHVFLSRGSDMLIIKRSHILPLTIKFKDYGIDCKFTDYDNFIYNLHLQKNEKILKYIISDLNNSRRFDYS